MSSGKATPHKDRPGKLIQVYVPDNEREALDSYCERTEETRTAVVRRAVRKELGLPEPKEET